MGMGWSGRSAIVIPLVVTSVSPLIGSLAGGLAVTITGTGFSTAPSENSVAFGPNPCTVISSSTSQLVCITGSSGAAITATTALQLSVTTYPGQPTPTVVPSATFTYEPSVTDTLISLNTTRGSTAGRTPLLIQGSFHGSATDYSVLIGGGSNCSIVAFSSTAITCM